jgi:hypothetical protein
MSISTSPTARKNDRNECKYKPDASIVADGYIGRRTGSSLIDGMILFFDGARVPKSRKTNFNGEPRGGRRRPRRKSAEETRARTQFSSDGTASTPEATRSWVSLALFAPYARHSGTSGDFADCEPTLGLNRVPSAVTTNGRLMRIGSLSMASRSWSSVRSGLPRPSSAWRMPFSRIA